MSKHKTMSKLVCLCVNGKQSFSIFFKFSGHTSLKAEVISSVLRLYTCCRLLTV